MFSMASPFQRRITLQALLPFLTMVAVLALLGHFVLDAAKLWPGATAPAASNSGFQPAGGGRQDAASALHSGFAVAIVAANAVPAVLSVVRIWTYPRPQFRLYSPPFLPPKSY